MSMTSSATPARPPSLEEAMRRRRPPRNIIKEAAEKLTPLDRLALWITIRVGSMGVFLIAFCMDDNLVELEYVGTRAVTI